MTGRRAIVGLCMLCALAFSALMAQGASAETKGTTAFTCKEEAGTIGFADAHCKEPVSTGAKFQHVAFAANTPTKITGNNITTGVERSIAKLRSTQAGIEEELQAEEVEGEGELENVLEASGEHALHAKGTIVYKKVSVLKPAGKGCKVFEDLENKEMGVEGVVKTKPLKATSAGQGDRILLEPETGTTFATFWVTNCTTEALNGTYEVTGKLTATTEGATLIATHNDVTTQGTLKTRGQKSGLDGSLTIKGTDLPGDKVDTPLSVTTVSTP
jgi:hypothetical protein